jgi:hypothetical protein
MLERGRRRTTTTTHLAGIEPANTAETLLPA